MSKEITPATWRDPSFLDIFVSATVNGGPEVHFIYPLHQTKQAIYLATRDAGITLNLDSGTVSFPALLKLQLISRILCLRDSTTNPSNCGSTDDYRL